MDTLYHYCSTQAFESIISNRCIRLSSLSLSNDTMEGRLVAQTFDKLFSQLNMSSEESEIIRESIKFVEGVFDGLGFCLSEEPDLLSQWRGYANDGQGLCIGFNKQYLRELAGSRAKGERGFILDKVLYETDEHINAIKPTFSKIKKIVEDGKLKKNRFGINSSKENIEKRIDEYREALKSVMRKVGGTYNSLYVLKNSAFSEEAEWRLISYLSKDSNDQASYRAAHNRLIPYREFKLKKLNKDPINEIYIGPKNITPDFVIEKFLLKNEINNVRIKRSSATYR